MTNNLLVELGTEELPPKNLKAMMQSLQSAFQQGLQEAQLEFKEVKAYATPRRLSLVVENLSASQPEQNIERKGPSLKAALDDAGNPTKAAMGFMKSCGVDDIEQLEKVETEKGLWLVFRQQKPGATLAELIQPLFQKALQSLPIERRMRWGSSRAEFVRPVHWLVVLYGDQVLPCEVLGVQAGRTSRGHRFMSAGDFNIESADEYLPRLIENKVVGAFEERRAMIEDQLNDIAKSENAVIDMDPALLDEVTALVEWPVALMGSFPKEFLEVPVEALVSAMKEHQRYFPLSDQAGQMLPKFITISNIESTNPKAVVQGNERVILPRLTDARFFYDKDKKQTLESQLDRLKQVVFQSELGSYLDKVNRTKQLASYIASELGADIKIAERAAELCKSDLVSDMVGEFPDLQGKMGGYYAKNDGEPDAVAAAIEQHYLPTSSGGDLPVSLEAKCVAMADKLDTLTGMFGIGQPPSGSRDPFALRRQTIGIIRMCVETELNLNLHDAISKSVEIHGKPFSKEPIFDYLAERLKSWYQDQGIRFDSVEAVLGRGNWVANLNASNKSIKAIETFRDSDQSEALIAANKRVANILKKAKVVGTPEVDESLLKEKAEETLVTALRDAERKLTSLKDDTERLVILGDLREPVDRYFDDVMVMTDDEATRNNRIATLSQMRALFMQVADISLLQQQ